MRLLVHITDLCIGEMHIHVELCPIIGYKERHEKKRKGNKSKANKNKKKQPSADVRYPELIKPSSVPSVKTIPDQTVGFPHYQLRHYEELILPKSERAYCCTFCLWCMYVCVCVDLTIE